MTEKESLMIDIMSGREGASDLFWVLKDYESRVAYFANYRSNELMRRSIFESESLKYDLRLLADKTGRKEAELAKEAAEIVDGMRHKIGMSSIRLMGYVLSKVFKRIYRRVYVGGRGVEQLKQVRNKRVVLVPSHRSYADFLLMSFVMFECDLPLPVIAAAADFQSMRVVGELLRHCGAFFIRRQMASDPLYWTVFSHYIRALLSFQQEPLEFFIEGTRSRTNKSLSPKIGLLGIVLEHWLSSPDDTVLVPISISYERLLEETLYGWELLGIPKPRESTAGLLKVRHVLNDNYGNIYFNIGDLISISELAELVGIKRFHHNLQLRFKPVLFENEKQFLRNLANLIVERQQRNSVICDWSILVLILLHVQLRERRQLKLTEGSELLNLFLETCKLLRGGVGALLAVDCCGHNSNERETGINRISAALDLHRHSVVTTDHTVSLIGCLDPSGEPLPPLDSPLGAVLIVDRIRLGAGRNPVLFHIARESILLSRITHGCVNDWTAVRSDFSAVMDLMCREFIYCYGFLNDSMFDGVIARLESCDLLKPSGTGWRPNVEHPCYHLIESAVELHLCAYALYGRLMTTEQAPPAETNAADLCKFIQKSVMRVCSTNASFGQSFMEMCSLDMIRNAVARFREISRQSVGAVSRAIIVIDTCLSPAVKELLQGIS